MLRTTLDGLWLLQVLTGHEVLAPELGLRPYLPTTETRQSALSHPVAVELEQAGVISLDGAVDPMIDEWLAALSRRDVSWMFWRYGAGCSTGDRALLARFAQWWVLIKRSNHMVEISGVGTANTEEAATELIAAQVERSCPPLEPAALRPVTLRVEDLLDPVRRTEVIRGLEHDQASIMVSAADVERSTQCSVIALQQGTRGGPALSHVSTDPVTIIDTPSGRLVAELVEGHAHNWLLVGPGSIHNISRAIVRASRRLPAQSEWHSYRRVM